MNVGLYEAMARKAWDSTRRILHCSRSFEENCQMEREIQGCCGVNSEKGVGGLYEMARKAWDSTRRILHCSRSFEENCQMERETAEC